MGAAQTSAGAGDNGHAAIKSDFTHGRPPIETLPAPGAGRAYSFHTSGALVKHGAPEFALTVIGAALQGFLGLLELRAARRAGNGAGAALSTPAPPAPP